MLPISYKMERCHNECAMLISQLEQLNYVLEDSKAPGVRLDETVGRIAKELADEQRENGKGQRRGKTYVTLAADVNEILKELRMVCSGEISIEEAQRQVNKAIRELKAIKSSIVILL